ncbi:hypothetical protein T4D_16166 [Trichinella pseudospiralis]|uniref:Uncharacterized protein n=1 Tax=Trichinella pseudospiralis TaxID=6337 RepID=A0A0V1G517_TRIPS|nr:hypothetical protein T4D_16166 [Trichinella pseudospiralis]
MYYMKISVNLINLQTSEQRKENKQNISSTWRTLGKFQLFTITQICIYICQPEIIKNVLILLTYAFPLGDV